jgi:hypothetical protein
MDFHMCSDSSMIYIKEPLLRHRLHMANDSFQAADNLMEVIGPYVLQHQFAEMAMIYGMSKAEGRLSASVEKVGRQAMRYSIRALNKLDERGALRYYHLAIALSPNILEDQLFQKLSVYWEADATERQKILNSLDSAHNLVTRTVSYDPPPGSISLEVGV